MCVGICSAPMYVACMYICTYDIICNTKNPTWYCFFSLCRVHTPDADIDVLCLAPRHCSREAFFTSFRDILHNHAEVDELFPVPQAYTPVSFRLWCGVVLLAGGDVGTGGAVRIVMVLVGE